MNDPSAAVDTVKAETSQGRAVVLRLQESTQVRSPALTGLFLLALGYTLYFARAILLPVVVALLLYFILYPLIKRLKALHIPEAWGAAIVLLAFLSLVGYGAYQLTGPATEWVSKAPQSLQRLESKLRPIQQSVQEVQQATEQVEKITQGTKGGAEQQVVKVDVQRQSLASVMLNVTSSFVAGLVTMLILLYFLLASGDLFLRKLVEILPRLQDKKAAVGIVHQLEHDTSLYLLTVTLINTGLGVVTGLLMLLVGMPNPVLWGVVAGVLNFVPYVSSVITTIFLGLAAILTFDQLGRILLVPGIYIVLNSLEGFVVTPLIHSQRFTIHPVVILVWLAFWGWIWGIAGTLLAMPMLIMFKILYERLEIFNVLFPSSQLQGARANEQEG